MPLVYKPEYVKIFDGEANIWVGTVRLGGPRYNQWAHKNKYTDAISTILKHWRGPVIFSLVDCDIIKSHEDESLEWTLKNRDSLAQFFHGWPLSDDPDMPERYKCIRNGLWGAAIVARLAGKGKRYIKMFAGREEMIEDDAYSLDYEGAYSYMAVKEKIKAPEETPYRSCWKEKEAPEAKPEENNVSSTGTSLLGALRGHGAGESCPRCGGWPKTGGSRPGGRLPPFIYRTHVE